MKNCFKCNESLNIVTVFSCIEGVQTHLANIDKRTNRIYTTNEAYEFLATSLFKQSHTVRWFDEDNMNGNTPYRKFSISVEFEPKELLGLIEMCSRPIML